MIDLRVAHLRTFLAVAEVQHFGRAASRLGLGQSAVSQHVRALEAELGVELLARTSRSVRLTAAGERFAPEARSMLSALERAAADARAVGAGELGTLRVAAQQSARTFLVPAVLAVLARDAPGLTLDVLSTTTAGGVQAVQRGDADVALVRDPRARAGIVTEALVSDPVMVALPAGHRHAARDAIALEELRGEPRIGWARPGAPDYHDQLAALLRTAGIDGPPAYELRGVDTRLGAVAGGLGFSLESAAYRTMFADRVRFVAIAGEPLRGSLVAAWPAVYAAPGLPALLAAARRAAVAQ